MNDLRNEKIKRLERRVLKANRLSDEELREIVSAPQLFDKIHARIKLAKEGVQTPPAAFCKPEKLPFWRLPKLAPVFGGLLVFLACAVGLIFFTRAEFSVSKLNESTPAPEIENEPALVENAEINEPGKAENSVGESRNIAKKIVFKNKSPKAERR